MKILELKNLQINSSQTVCSKLHKMQKSKNKVDQFYFPTRFIICENADQEFLWTSGLNPCMGIVISGTISTKESGNKKFVILNHNDGRDADARQREIATKENLEKIYTEIISEVMQFNIEFMTNAYRKNKSITFITIDEINIFRCTSEETSNKHLANAIKSTLAIKEKCRAISDIITEKMKLKISFSTDYEFSLEEQEVPSDTADSMDVAIIAKNAQFMAVFHKGPIGIFQETPPSSDAEPAKKDVFSTTENIQALTKTPITPNGNCLFAAVASGIRQQQIAIPNFTCNTTNLRALCVNVLRANKDKLKTTLIILMQANILESINKIAECSKTSKKPIEVKNILEDSFLKNVAIYGYSGDFFRELKSILKKYYDVRSDILQEADEITVRSIFNTLDNNKFFDEYCNSMSADGAWADTLAIYALSHDLKINIKICQSIQGDGYYPCDQIDNAIGEIVLLSSANRHFDLLTLQQENSASEEEEIKKTNDSDTHTKDTIKIYEIKKKDQSINTRKSNIKKRKKSSSSKSSEEESPKKDKKKDSLKKAIKPTKKKFKPGQ